MGRGTGRLARKQVAVFDANELSRRSQEILDAAREGEVGLSNSTGPDLVILTRPSMDALKEIARTALSLSEIEAALAASKSAVTVDLSDVADWPWLREYTPDDIREFADNLRQALVQAEEQDDTSPIDDVLKGWRLSAEILADPLGREIFCGPRGEDDFIEVSRPE